jgi:hypothetical protein
MGGVRWWTEMFRELESRSWNNMTDGIARTRNYVGLDPGVAGDAPGYNCVLVAKPGSVWGSASTSQIALNDVSDYFGLPVNEGGIQQTEYGYTTLFSASTYPPVNSPDEWSRWVWYSHQDPVGTTQGLFVRTPSLTNKSYNMGKSIPSQIIYHCPKFDNQGNSSGDMYFEAAEKTYLCLDNTEEIQLNDMQIELVDKNERISQDLVGATIVVLHFRKSSR